MTDLTQLRHQINQVDEQLLDLLSKRGILTQQVGHYKLAHRRPIRDENREEQLLTALASRATELQLSPHYVTQIFRLIIADSVRHQNQLFLKHHQTLPSTKQPLRVAFLGDKGSYSNIAVNRYFGEINQAITEIGCPTFAQIIQQVEQRSADYALLPLVNTSSGSINEVYDLLQQTHLSIIGELTINVDHGILTKAPGEIRQIKTIYGHPQPFAQCSQFLAKYPHIKFEYVDSSSKAMQLIAASNNPHIAAIGSETGGKMYGLQSIQSQIANQQENFTRFIVVGRTGVEVPVHVEAKTTLIMATEQNPGSLANALQELADEHINMTRLESRPVQGNPWQEMFYVDVLANVSSEAMQRVLGKLTQTTRFIKVLGCYPAGDVRSPSLPLTVLANQPSQALNEAPSLISRNTTHALSSLSHQSHPTTITVGEQTLGDGSLSIFAGPDTLESQVHLEQCASLAADHGAAIIHGACFKSIGTPYDYQGPGLMGLKWLKQAHQYTQLPTMTEVTHIENLHAIAAQIDIIQIGAANMHNYPLLKAAGHTTNPIVLERGTVASLDEWLKAADYILAQGNQQVILCERGIRSADHQTRSLIDLSAIALLRQRTHLPIMLNPCDGVNQMEDIIPLALAAKRLGVDAIMLNIHPDPEHAKVAPHQSLNFAQFTQLMQQLYHPDQAQERMNHANT